MKTITRNLPGMLLLSLLASPLMAQELSEKLQGKMEDLSKTLLEIPETRRTQLDQTAWMISRYYETNKQATILLIDSDPAGRSQLGRVWLQSSFYYFGLPKIAVHSGGLQGGELNPEILAVLEPWGFKVKANKNDPGTWLVDFGSGKWELESSAYDASFNPGSEYIAIFMDGPAALALEDKTSASLEIPLMFDKSDLASGQQWQGDLNEMLAREMFYIAYRTKLNLENL